MRHRMWKRLTPLLVLTTVFAVTAYSGELEYGLSVAAMEGDVNKVADLLKKGADPNFTNGRGVTVLLEVAGAGLNQVVQVLLENGAKINFQDKRGMTPLMEAASKGRLETVKILLDKGADVNLKSTTGATALAFAQLRGNAQVVELLKAKGAQ